MLRLVAMIVAALATSVALAQTSSGWYPIHADDGSPIANHRVPVELESKIEQLPGVAILGNRSGDVTLVEFYDLNCPYCRKAAPEIAALLQADGNLRLILVPFPVLSVASIQAARVELAVLETATPRQFYAFHRQMFAGRGVVDGARALAVASQLGFDRTALAQAADADAITAAMTAHVRLGDALELEATPGFVIKGIAVVGYPGARALGAMIDAVRRCDQILCASRK